MSDLFEIGDWFACRYTINLDGFGTQTRWAICRLNHNTNQFDAVTWRTSRKDAEAFIRASIQVEQLVGKES